MLDDRDYMRSPREKPTPGRALRSAWSIIVARLRWLLRFFQPQRQIQITPVEHRKVDEESTTDEYLENEVDPILEKISAKGLRSLTAREREILETARRKMTRP